jgi:hypothetical protein
MLSLSLANDRNLSRENDTAPYLTSLSRRQDNN